MGPILVRKSLRRGSHFTKIAEKIVKSAILWGKETPRNESRFAKNKKKKKKKP